MSDKQLVDSGLALVLICLIAALALDARAAVIAALIFTIVTMTVPGVFRPFAVFWFGLSRAIGTVVSKVLLTLVFFLLVAPMALARKALGKDSLRLKQWKQSAGSVFTERGHEYTAKDIETPY